MWTMLLAVAAAAPSPIARGLVLPELPPPHLHRELLAPWATPVTERADPSAVALAPLGPDPLLRALGGTVSLSARGWLDDTDELRTSVLPGLRGPDPVTTLRPNE